MCSGSEEGSYLRLIDFVYHSTLGLRVIKREKVPVVGDDVLVVGWIQEPDALLHACLGVRYRGTSLIRNAHPPRNTIGP